MTMHLRPLTTPTHWLAGHRSEANTYDGRELRPYQGRPGAMDAYALPSMVAGVRIPRSAPICAPTTNRV